MTRNRSDSMVNDVRVLTHYVDLTQRQEKKMDVAHYASPSAKSLSADAPPFKPMYGPVMIAIYNNGIPCLMLTSESDLYNILAGIQDEALDETFPPDAFDAAELDEMDYFIDILACLDLMEEREERCRASFAHVQKRWEARRARGLISRPRPAKHSIQPASHQTRNPPNANKIRTMVTYSSRGHHHHHQARDGDGVLSVYQRQLMYRQGLHGKKLNTWYKPTMQHQFQYAIQQPRKGF